MGIRAKRLKDKEKQVNIGKFSEIDTFSTTTNSESKVQSLLRQLRSTTDVYESIDLLINEHPDTSMAFQMLLSLVNQGGTIQFESGNNSKEILFEWNEFASNVGKTCSNGLEGIIYQLHASDFSQGAMACEVVVNRSLEIEDIYVIEPKTINWKLDKQTQTYRPFQKINSKEIDLSKANLLWIPFNPKVGNPNGTLLFKPVLQAADMQLEFFESSQKVLYRAGTPRYDVEINRESLIQTAPTEIKSDVTGKSLQKWINETISAIKANFRNMGAINDLVHTDDTKIDIKGANNSAFFQGISAYADIIDTQIMNALKVLGTLMNRHNQGGSYALSTVEFKAIVDMLEPRQRAEKRMVEQIAKIWLKTKGYIATVKWTPNPIEWQTFKDKMEYLLSKQEYYRRSEEYGYISPDEASKNTMGNDVAYNPTERLFAYVKNVKAENQIIEKNTDSGGD